MSAISFASSVSSYISAPLVLASAALQKKEVTQLGKDLSSGSLLLAQNDAKKALRAFNTSLGFNLSLSDSDQRTVSSSLKSIYSSLQNGNSQAAISAYNQLQKTLGNSGAISTADSPTLAAASMAANSYVTGTTINTAVIDALANSSSTRAESTLIYNATAATSTLVSSNTGTVLNAKA